MPPRIAMKAAARKPVKKATPGTGTAVSSSGGQPRTVSRAPTTPLSRAAGPSRTPIAPLPRAGLTPFVKYKGQNGQHAVKTGHPARPSGVTQRANGPVTKTGKPDGPSIGTGMPGSTKSIPKVKPQVIQTGGYGRPMPKADVPPGGVPRADGSSRAVPTAPRTGGPSIRTEKPGSTKAIPKVVPQVIQTGGSGRPMPRAGEEVTETARPTGGKTRPRRTADPSVKKPYRYRAGTVALRSVNRADNIDDDVVADPDFVVPELPDPDVQDSRETRMSKMKFLKAAKSLEPLAVDHDPEEESFPYYTFFMACYSEGARLFKLVHNTVFISAQGSWYAMIVRHAGDASKQASIRRSAEKNGGIPAMFWQRGTATVSTAVMDIRRYRMDFKKPIAVFMGEQHVTTGAGHAVIVIMYYEDGYWKAIMKDCLPHQEMGAYSLSMSLLRELGFSEVLLVCELEREEHILRTCCVKESFVYSSSVMEGIFPSELLGQSEKRYKRYSLTCRKYI